MVENGIEYVRFNWFSLRSFLTLCREVTEPFVPFLFYKSLDFILDHIERNFVGTVLVIQHESVDRAWYFA